MLHCYLGLKGWFFWANQKAPNDKTVDDITNSIMHQVYQHSIISFIALRKNSVHTKPQNRENDSIMSNINIVSKIPIQQMDR